MQITSHLLSDVGRVRRLNEDSARIVEGSGAAKTVLGDLYILADGMGGHEAGEVASQLAVDTIADYYYQHPGPPDAALRDAIEEANRVIYHSAQEEDRYGMGTTVVAAALVGETLYHAHVGDSRLYLVRGGRSTQLTRDHSLVAEQIEAGLLSPEEAVSHPHRNIISRAVGTTPHVEVESPAEPLRLYEGDVILICSDGLTEHVPSERIEQLVRNRTPEEAAQTLVDAANAAGGSDNISVIVLRAGDATAVAAEAPPLAPRVPGPVVRPRARPARRGLPLWGATLLVVLLLGGAGVIYLFRDTPAVQEPGGIPTIPDDATETPEATASARTTRTPRATSTPVLSPSSTPPTSTLPAPVAPPGIALLAPPAETITSSAVITFSAIISNLQIGDEVQLRMGTTPEELLIVTTPLIPRGMEWSVALTQPPGGQYGSWYWNIVVVSTATGTRTVYRGPERRLEWLAPGEPTVEPSGTMTP